MLCVYHDESFSRRAWESIFRQYEPANARFDPSSGVLNNGGRSKRRKIPGDMISGHACAALMGRQAGTQASDQHSKSPVPRLYALQ